MRRNLDQSGLTALVDRPGVSRAFAALDEPGAETRLIGGCVRDALLGIAAADIDLATTLLPEAVLARARAAGLKAVPTGIEHGTITLIIGDGPIEVTTLREDVETDGRHAVVRFGGDFARDAERRDFTVNALSLGRDGRLHDTVGGLADLEAGRVRFIGDPATRIREDALRILRFFRFHARFGSGTPDPEALAACVAARDSLRRLSRERIRDEFLKLLMATGGPTMVVTLSATGLLQRITGGVGELGRLERAARADLPPVMRLAALAVGARHDADRLRDRLRLSNQEHGQLTAYADVLAALHDRATIDESAARSLAAEHGLTPLTETLAILAGEPRPHVTDGTRQALLTLRGEGGPPTFPLAGADLVAAGIPPGPTIGRALAAARRLWLERGCPSGPEARAGLLDHALDHARAPQ
ncbi:tRNA nucleotidyltransferase/poly(A) polymerase [Methylobacterium phyllostachyos]|uniref:tRNA nucleotidyltransferase/poly(A) polymerase n=1 Tax=Methylobacterium phyllostachyos TaxID=582672 RepID=A0A1G9TGX8_9HYPH|nr:CCA tRNA nucleotidyltransferase [Methylobacterium phyllostachyos]SDM46385.1 tRNA nucleotidyltransferase/poly(A) polymerase [Methylobacterium phyllostachyos]